jgi:hypothetical protein
VAHTSAIRLAPVPCHTAVMARSRNSKPQNLPAPAADLEDNRDHAVSRRPDLRVPTGRPADKDLSSQSGAASWLPYCGRRRAARPRPRRPWSSIPSRPDRAAWSRQRRRFETNQRQVEYRVFTSAGIYVRDGGHRASVQPTRCRPARPMSSAAIDSIPVLDDVRAQTEHTGGRDWRRHRPSTRTNSTPLSSSQGPPRGTHRPCLNCGATFLIDSVSALVAHGDYAHHLQGRPDIAPSTRRCKSEAPLSCWVLHGDIIAQVGAIVWMCRQRLEWRRSALL